MPGSNIDNAGEPMEYVLYTRGLDDRSLSAQQMATLTKDDKKLEQVKRWIQGVAVFFTQR